MKTLLVSVIRAAFATVVITAVWYGLNTLYDRSDDYMTIASVAFGAALSVLPWSQKEEQRRAGL